MLWLLVWCWNVFKKRSCTTWTEDRHSACPRTCWTDIRMRPHLAHIMIIISCWKPLMFCSDMILSHPDPACAAQEYTHTPKKTHLHHIFYNFIWKLIIKREVKTGPSDLRELMQTAVFPRPITAQRVFIYCEEQLRTWCPRRSRWERRGSTAQWSLAGAERAEPGVDDRRGERSRNVSYHRNKFRCKQVWWMQESQRVPWDSPLIKLLTAAPEELWSVLHTQPPSRLD